MSTITQDQENAITAFLDSRHIPSGLGTETEACSIAAINLALTCELTDKIPECMSPVIGTWIITTQDAMPDAMRNSPEWRRLLPLAAGTGRDPEQEKARLALIMDWMWITVLPTLQPFANAHRFGTAWRTMSTQRTDAAANAADAEAAAAKAAVARWAARAADAAAAARAARAAGAAAWAAQAAADAAADGAAWATFDPCALLERMVNA